MIVEKESDFRKKKRKSDCGERERERERVIVKRESEWRVF